MVYWAVSQGLSSHETPPNYFSRCSRKSSIGADLNLEEISLLISAVICKSPPSWGLKFNVVASMSLSAGGASHVSSSTLVSGCGKSTWPSGIFKFCRGGAEPSLIDSLFRFRSLRFTFFLLRVKSSHKWHFCRRCVYRWFFFLPAHHHISNYFSPPFPIITGVVQILYVKPSPWFQAIPIHLPGNFWSEATQRDLHNTRQVSKFWTET